MRERHARAFVRRIQPAAWAVGYALVIVALLTEPERVDQSALALIALGTGNVAGCLVALRWHSAIRVATFGIAVTTGLLLLYVVTSSAPEETAAILLWPIILTAYFGRPSTALALSVACGIGIAVLAGVLDSWPDDRLIPTASYIIAVSGMLLAFVTQQGRHIEHVLSSGLARDRVALRLARGIRMADDPSEAIHEIARTLGGATGAQRSVVVLLEHDDHYVADIATWQRERDSPPLDLDVTSIDATLRHLVSTGYGALLDQAGARLLTPVDSDEVLPPGDSSVEASMRALLGRLGGESGVVAALPMGSRAVGAIVLVADAGHDWESEALPLLDTIAPQLAAGLAQVVLVRDQRDALESLERLDRMRDRLIANVSHELRTPLTSTIGFIETLLRDDVPFDDRTRFSMMEHARDGGLRLLALVEDLLALGSTRPESLDLAPEPMRASQLVVDAIRGINLPEHRRIALQVDDDPMVTVDRNRMLQVFGNLVVNAVHHGAGDVEVHCYAHEAGALVDVIDDGPGVAPEHVHELFLPFARFSTRSDSTGLGLAICRTIVEAHGGAIDYARIAGGRTRFRVRIPTRRSTTSER